MSKESSKTVSETSKNSGATNKAREAGIYVWGAMSGMYGSKFTAQFGESLNPVWVSCLKNLNELQVKQGLKLCLKQCPDWPPSAPAFRKMCEGSHEASHIDFNSEDHSYYIPKRIESSDNKEKRRRKAQAEIKKLKTILEG